MLDRVYFFNTWQEVYDCAREFNVCQADITNAQFIDDLKTISSATNKNFFAKREFETIHDLINQIHFYKSDVPHGYAFIDDIHILGTLLRKAPAISGFNKMHKAIFTNFGMFDQFMITMWVNEYMHVKEVELSNKPINTDLLLEIDGMPVHFQLKTIKEEARRDRMRDAIWEVDGYFDDKARRAQLEFSLSVTQMEGTPPEGMPRGYWENLAKTLPYKPQTVRHTIKAGAYKNKEDVTVKIKMRWRKRNYTSIAPEATFNNAERFAVAYDEHVAKVAKSTDCHILCVNTWDEYDVGQLRNMVEESGVGVMVVNRFGYHILGYTIILPAKFNKIEVELVGKLPPRFDFVRLILPRASII